MPKFIAQLDKPRELRYDLGAFSRLMQEHGINAMRPSTYADFNPHQGLALIWAGQLHSAKPLTFEQVGKVVPTDPEGYMGVMEVVARALAYALGGKPNADKPVGP
jgi:hypothetical protein